MSKMKISIDTILKHRRLSSYVLETGLSNDAIEYVKNIFNNCLKSTNEASFEKNYREMINNIQDSIVANRSYNYPLLAIEKTGYNNKKYTDLYESQVVPRLDTDSLSNLNDTIDQYQLGDEVKDSMKSIIEANLIADRILNNHNNISDRFNIEEIIVNSSRLGESTVAEQTVNFIDTYKVRPYQKMNLCLEEIYYVLGKNDIEYNKSAMVKSVVETFMLSGYEEKKENYIKVLENNYCFTEEETLDARTTLNDDTPVTGTIQSIIDEYIRVGTIPLYDFCVNIGGCSTNDIKLNIGLALEFVWRCVNTNGAITYEEMNEALKGLFESMANKIATSEEVLSLEDVKEIDTSIDAFLSEARRKSRSDLYAEDQSKFDAFENAVNLAKDQFLKDCSYLYNRNNIDTIAKLNTESAGVVSLQEFKKFRFNNLVKAGINLEKYIKAKAESVFKAKKRKPFLRRIKSVLFGEGYNVENFIKEDGKVDICVAQYYYNEACEYECKSFLGDICKSFNSTITDPNMKAYYIFNPGIAEVHIKENHVIELTEEEQIKVNESEDPSLNIYIESLGLIDIAMEKIFNGKVDSIFSDPTVTLEQFEMVVEALSYFGMSKSDIESITERFSETRYRYLVSENATTADKVYREETTIMESIVENYEEIDEFVSLDIKLEAAMLIEDILEAGIKKPDIKKATIKKADASDYDDDDDEDYDNDGEDNDDDDEDDEDKEDKKEKSPEEKAKEKKQVEDDFDPKGGKSPLGKAINSLRLILKGLRAKLGDMGSKEQEVSKNLDAGVEHLIKGIHDALISDRREAIIKGSVIPSFSRCIKYGITLAGMGGLSVALVGNIIPVVILAIGAFAVSKKLTNQERMLLLDDLETELDVVEKEIQNAESKNQMKKYRALLKYKKDLQRQYQRIKYNRRIGKDLMPNSATGVYKPEG